MAYEAGMIVYVLISSRSYEMSTGIASFTQVLKDHQESFTPVLLSIPWIQLHLQGYSNTILSHNRCQIALARLLMPLFHQCASCWCSIYCGGLSPFLKNQIDSLVAWIPIDLHAVITTLETHLIMLSMFATEYLHACLAEKLEWLPHSHLRQF